MVRMTGGRPSEEEQNGSCVRKRKIRNSDSPYEEYVHTYTYVYIHTRFIIYDLQAVCLLEANRPKGRSREDGGGRLELCVSEAAANLSKKKR